MGEDDYEGLYDDANKTFKTATQYLDEQGVDPRFCSEPFLEASEFGDASSLRQRLCQLSGDEQRHLLRAVDQHGCTGLLLFAKKGDSEMVDVLLGAGAIVHDADTSGVTALHFAAGRGSAAMVKSLLSFAADVEAKDQQNETPLMWARGRTVTTLLMEARADVNATDISGHTALMLASRKGDEETIDVLAELPQLDLDICNTQGQSAHALALAAGHRDAADLLVRLGAKADVKPASRIIRREEAFLESARRGDATACQAFLQEGVDIDAEVGGETALLLAAGAACSRAVETLLHGKADANRGDPFMGETPLIRAVLSGGTHEMLWMLLEARADPAKQDVSGRMAVDVANAWGRHEAAEILKAAANGELRLGAMD